MNSSTNLWKELYSTIKAEKWEESLEQGNLLIKQVFKEETVHPFFKELLDKDVLKLFKDIELMTCKPGQVIMREGERGDAMFIIVSGTVNISSKRPKIKGVAIPIPPVLINSLVVNLIQGNTLAISNLHEGEIFGEMALLSSKPRAATVTIAKNTELIKITTATFNNVIDKNPHLRSLLNELYMKRLESMVSTLKNAGKNVKTCLIGSLISRKKDKSLKIQDKEIPVEINEYLKDIEFYYNKGMKKDALAAYLKLGKTFFKDIANDYLHIASGLFNKDFLLNIPVVYKMIIKLKLDIYLLKTELQKSPVKKLTASTKEVSSLDEDFLSLFNEKIRANLDKANVKQYDKSAVVIKYGDLSDTVYVIKKGTVRVVSKDNKEIAVLTDGEVFGEFAFITDQPRSASVIADGKLSLYELDRPLLKDIIKQNPEALDYLHEIYQKRVDSLVETIYHLKQEISD